MDQSKGPRPQDAFYTPEELATIGFKSFGTNVLVSRKASIYRPEAISIGSNVRIDDFALLSGGAGIEIGNYVHIGVFSALFGGGGITLEDFINLSARATVLSESDDLLGRSLPGAMVPSRYRPTLRRARVIFRRHSGMGINSTVLPGVEMGEGAGLGAYSMATKSCAPWTLSVGTPVSRSVRRSKKVLELEQQFVADLAAEQHQG